MIEFTTQEITFFNTLEEARIATSHDDVPHVKPVSFVYDSGVILVATDYNTRTFLNIQSNPKTSIVMDIYSPGHHKAILIQGISSIIENGGEFQRLYDLFYNKFEWVRNDPWKEKEAPFLKIIPKVKTSWGIN